MCHSNIGERRRESRPPPTQRIYHQFNRAIKRESLLKTQLPNFPLDHQLFFNRINQLQQKGAPLNVAIPEVLITDGLLTDGQLIA